MTAIPTALVAGYLGAGKTTLINRWLGAAHGERLVVLVNDFGAVNIDAELIRLQADCADRVIELSNGCVCCQIGDDLGNALERVLALRPPPEAIVIEASGVAEPARVRALCAGWSQLAPIDAVVVVDGSRIRRLSADKYVGGLVQRQMLQADRLLVRGVDAWERRRFEKWLRSLGVKQAIDWKGERSPAWSGPALLGGGLPGCGFDGGLAESSARWWRHSGTARPLSADQWRWWWSGRPERVQRAKGFVPVSEECRGGEATALLQAAGEVLLLEVGHQRTVGSLETGRDHELVIIASADGAEPDDRRDFDLWCRQAMIVRPGPSTGCATHSREARHPERG